MKQAVYRFLDLCGVDNLFRYLTRSRMLILAYHGVTDIHCRPMPDTMVRLEPFRRQIRFLAEHYHVMSLVEAAEFIVEGRSLPPNSAVLTLDDGYLNNLTLALPILEEYSLPATVFLASAMLGSPGLLPIDRLFINLAAAKGGPGFSLPELFPGHQPLVCEDDVRIAYTFCAQALKGMTIGDQNRWVDHLTELVQPDTEEVKRLEPVFRLLDRDQVLRLVSSGLISIGAHTESHEILTNIQNDQAQREISRSKRDLEELIGGQVLTFAFPNGKESDFTGRHLKMLRSSGYICSVTTIPRFNAVNIDPFTLGRICVNDENAGDHSRFRLLVSGFNSFKNKLKVT